MSQLRAETARTREVRAFNRGAWPFTDAATRRYRQVTTSWAMSAAGPRYAVFAHRGGVGVVRRHWTTCETCDLSETEVDLAAYCNPGRQHVKNEWLEHLRRTHAVHAAHASKSRPMTPVTALHLTLLELTFANVSERDLT